MSARGAARALALLLAVAAAAPGAPSASAAAATRFLPWTEAPPAPVVLKDLAGRPTAMADYRGKVVVVAFWATWCEFCKEQMLAMQQLKRRLAGEPFEILAVNFAESPARVRRYLQALPVDLRVVLDPNQDAARAWHVRVLPVSYVVDAEGRPRYAVVGEFDWASDEAVTTIRQLLPSP